MVCVHVCVKNGFTAMNDSTASANIDALQIPHFEEYTRISPLFLRPKF